MTKVLRELKEDFEALWVAYVECDVDELSPSGLRQRKEIIRIVKTVIYGPELPTDQTGEEEQ